MLQIDDVHAYYGLSHILQGVSLSVSEGELVALLGRNGVGKTTTLKTIIGLLRPKRGSLTFDGKDLSEFKDYEISRLGMGYVPQGRHIFPELSVRENLIISLVTQKFDDRTMEPIFEYFPVLKNRLKQKGGTLSGGEQQMLAIGRALITEPKLLLMDEPTEGLMPMLVALMKEKIQAINETGVAILQVEQRLETAVDLGRRVYIMEKGRVVYESTPQDLMKNRAVAERHLGTKA
jgi:branched-chain amino acid transport system ATP-binding protein